ncbi:MAG: hypothetical protein KDD56_09165, partial [Bdellovibrionales bacterium]|nr:hypothetical protein [Bdellovibrionales bacterium]
MPSLETADSRLLKVVRRDARPHTRWELTRAFPDDVDSLRVMGKSSVYSDSRNRIRGGTVEEIIENHKLTAGKQLNSNRYFFKKTVRRIERLINDKKLDLNTATLILDFFTDYINNYGISAEDFNRIKPLVEKCSHGLFENNQENPSGFQTLARNLH